MSRLRHVIGNWKMNGSKAHVDAFFSELVRESTHKINHVEGIICPPAIYLPQAAHWLAKSNGFKLGAQDVSEFGSGAHTGQIAPSMLIEHQCQYVIIGHSERRQYEKESEAVISNKFFNAQTAGLIPILCVGETQSQRESKLTNEVVVNQLKTVLNKNANAFKGALLAYEPVWAIGTGLTATPSQAQDVHYLLRQTIAEYDATVANTLPILYGGSVKPNNASTLFEMPDIDGALVGGASFELPDFLAIYKAAG